MIYVIFYAVYKCYFLEVKFYLYSCYLENNRGVFQLNKSNDLFLFNSDKL